MSFETINDSKDVNLVQKVFNTNFMNKIEKMPENDKIKSDFVWNFVINESKSLSKSISFDYWQQKYEFFQQQKI